MQLADGIAPVTGTSHGIGRDIALALTQAETSAAPPGISRGNAMGAVLWAGKDGRLEMDFTNDAPDPNRVDAITESMPAPLGDAVSRISGTGQLPRPLPPHHGSFWHTHGFNA